MLAEKTVFRLRGCPADLDKESLRYLLSSILGDVAPSEIHVQSLARGHGLESMSRTATLMFSRIPAYILDRQDQKSWRLDVGDIRVSQNRRQSCEALSLDTLFEGFTPLNDVEEDAEAIDCIAISGLASHPFGSWQEKKAEKSYMWIRDSLPVHLPNVRAIIYGYDSRLVKSRSFQSIGEIAATFRDRLLPMKYSSSNPRPLVFLAHSLGGIILKKALVMLADSGPGGSRLLDRVLGGIFFGVPNRGMDQEALLTAVRGHPNQTLVTNLAKDSDYLLGLDKSFSGIGSIHRMKFNWAYETTASPTVTMQADGTFARQGPLVVLVSSESATRGLFGSDFKNVFPINRDHSDMVKYAYNDPICQEVLNRLSEIYAGDTFHTRRNEVWTRRMAGGRSGWDYANGQTTEINHDSWLEDMMDTLFVPEMDGRYANIEDNSSKTFEWIYEPSKTKFVEWLAHGSGLFWIQGDGILYAVPGMLMLDCPTGLLSKPGSGKSTLMRFIARDERTEQCLEGQSLISQPRQLIQSRHFFHNRGTILQKSFEGLLRSLLFQILNAAPQLFGQIKSTFDDMTAHKTKTLWNRSNLRTCLHRILQQSQYDINLFILLDALDEYDGSPDQICVFLEDLLQSIGDRTRVQILFSSRPWEIFNEHFKNVDGLRLQEHNGPDIEIYCKNKIMDQDEKFRPLLRPLVPEIVRRAEGVFIWVKYALQGLVTAATKECDEGQLLAILNSVPTDLVEYYTSVIRRIRYENRRAAYALFQLVESRLEGQGLDSMDVLFAHSVWESSTYVEAQDAFKSLMSKWVVDSFKMRYRAGSFQLPAERTHRFVRNRYLISRFENAAGYDLQNNKVSELSGGLLHVRKAPIMSRSKDMLDWHLNEQVTSGDMPLRTATAMKPLMTSFTEEDQLPVLIEPSHQTVDDFIQRPDFKALLLGVEGDFFHESRYTWMAKSLLVQGLLYDAGRMCMLSEMTTGRSMLTFLDSVPKVVWKEMYESDTREQDKKIDTQIDSPFRFAVINGLTLYLHDTLEIDTNIIKTTKEELILIAPMGMETYKDTLPDGRWKMITEGEDYLARHLDTTRLIVERGYNPEKTQAAYLQILWIIGARSLLKDRISLREQHYERWPMIAAQAKAVLLMNLGQDPNAQLSGFKTRIVEAKWNTEIKWRPIHVAGLGFTKKLHEAGADLNGADGQGNTPLDWLLASWDTGKGRKLRGLAHRLVESVDLEAERARWGKIAYLIKNGGVARTTPAAVWQSFTSRHSERLQRQFVTVGRRSGPGEPQDSVVNLDESASKEKDRNLLSRLTGSTLGATGFTDVVTRKEGEETVTYTNLGDDGSSLGDYFEDLELAVAHCSGLKLESLEPEVKKERKVFLWRSKG